MDRSGVPKYLYFIRIDKVCFKYLINFIFLFETNDNKKRKGGAEGDRGKKKVVGIEWKKMCEIGCVFL